jgi:polar amino acid transport system substrate-binding protein
VVWADYRLIVHPAEWESVMKSVIPCLTLWLMAWTPCAFAQAKTLVLNTSYDSPITSPDRTGFLDLLYRELFGRLGISFEILALPAERSLHNANEGIDDGIVCRVGALVNTYTNMVRSTEPVMQYQHVVFSRDKRFQVTGPESLEPYDVGIVTGWKIVERNTTRHRSRIMVDSGEQLFRMLDQGRVEVAVIERMVGMDMVKRLGIPGIRMLSPPLLTGDWYLYLHKRHADLIPLIDRELRKMKEDGSYDRIHREVLGRYELDPTVWDRPL